MHKFLQKKAALGLDNIESVSLGTPCADVMSFGINDAQR